jgi:DNA-binding transcriptional ArsR family regulator
VATLTGRTARSTLSPCDTPGVATANPINPASLSRAGAEADWHAVTSSIAGTLHVRISRDGGRTFPARYARPLPADPPGQPCTVPVYDPGSGTGRVLALDLDPGRDCGSGDAAAQVSAQADAIVCLVARLGGRCVTDVSPRGGRHVYVLFGAVLPWRELRDLARALSLRFPAIDPAPMASLGGQISPPGSRHKSGGWRVLSTSLEDARAAAGHPNGPEVWDALLTELAAELRHAEPLQPSGDVPDGAELDTGGVPWIPRLGGRIPLGAEHDQMARTGRWDQSRYPGRSEVRMAVLSAAAARGWQLADVQAAIASGTWKGLAGLYERRSEPGRLDRLLPPEWQKSIALVTGEKNPRAWPTSDTVSRPPRGSGSPAAERPVDNGFSADEYGRIRQWVTAADCAAEDPGRVKGWGGYGIAVRLVLAALAQAAMVSGSSVIEFGCRNLSLHSALSSRTVARVLRLLRNEEDPLIDLVSRRQLARADRYQLRIPDRYAERVRWRRRRAGRIEAIHPAFLVLGGTAGLVYQALGEASTRAAEVARTARLSASAVSTALRVLAEHGLAEHGPGGWRRGPIALGDVSESTGAAAVHRERAERYRRDRESWRARLRQYQGRRAVSVSERDGWWSLDDPAEYNELCRWPVIPDDGVRAPPAASRTCSRYATG